MANFCPVCNGDGHVDCCPEPCSCEHEYRGVVYVGCKPCKACQGTGWMPGRERREIERWAQEARKL